MICHLWKEMLKMLHVWRKLIKLQKSNLVFALMTTMLTLLKMLQVWMICHLWKEMLKMLHVWKKLIKLQKIKLKTESKFTREIGECMKISRKKKRLKGFENTIHFIFFVIDTVDSFTIQYYVILCNVKTSLVHPFSVRK